MAGQGKTRAGATIPAVAYVRVSKERDDMISPELQMRAINEFAAREGFRVVKTVEDIDLTGTTFDNRSVGQVLDGIKAGEYAAVLLWKWSRWGRNTADSLAYIARVEEAGGHVRSATEDADASTSAGYLSRGLNLLLADVESRQKSEGWKAVQSRRQERGLPHGGAPRFGYRKDGQAFVPDPVTGPALAEAFERYAAGVPMQRIIDDMNARGIRSVNGNPIRATSLFSTMDGGFAAGWLRSRSKPNGKAALRGDFDTWTKGAHEPLISEETWRAYEERRRTSKATPARSRVAAHSLSGLVRCECGARMVAATASNTATWRCAAQQDYKGCPVKGTSARMERLEAFVWGWVQVSAGGEGVAEAEERRLNALRRAEGETERISSELLRLNSRRDRLVELYMDNGIDRVTFDRKRAEIDAAITRTEAAHAEALAEARANGGEARQVFQGIAALWENADQHERRELLSRVVGSVVVKKGSHWNSDKYTVVPRWSVG